MEKNERSGQKFNTRIEDSFDIAPLKFYDQKREQPMMYVYPDTKHWCAGWLLYQAKHGGWVTLRKATDEDIERMSAAVIEAHHVANAHRKVGSTLSGE